MKDVKHEIKRMLFFVFIIVILPCVSNAVILPSIPDHLLPCYRSDGPANSAPYRLDVLLSTLKTIERKTQLDLRLFTTSLLRSLRLDGIERGASAVETEFVTPYHASAFQFHKYKLLMDMFLPNQALSLLSDIENILTLGEICMFHKMLSSTVSAWERGDENVVCPEIGIQISTTNGNTTRSNSRCPIEKGVIQTDWGTISPGIVLAAIAASLESQRVLVTDILNADTFKNSLAEPLESDPNSFNELINIEMVNNIDTVKDVPRMSNADISNVWVATLAGDLAEVAVNQGPRIGFRSRKVIIGGASRWNDTLLPRHYYMLNHTNSSVNNNNWQFTDAEILAGIDGIILAHHVPLWISQRESLRASQILEMYYSNEGVFFDPTVKACNRPALFKKILDLADLITEVSNFAQVLSLRQGSVFIPVAEMDDICKAVVEAFTEYYPTLLSRYSNNCGVANNVPAMDLIVATDASWGAYEIERFTSWLGDASDVGLSGSTLGLLHGNTANWIVPSSKNLTAFFEYRQNYTGDWPNRLNFPNILTSLIRHFENKSLEYAANNASVSPSTVVLIVSPTDRLSETQSEQSGDLMQILRASYFDVYFAYVAQELDVFKNINSGDYDYSEFFLQAPSTSVEDIIKIVDEQIIKIQVPKNIIGPHCPFNGTEFRQVSSEYSVELNKTNEYRIYPFYLKEQPLVNVHVRNNGHGSLKICSWQGSERPTNCIILNERQIHIINFTNPCPSAEFCPPAHISISGVTTNNNCANNDCRYPHSSSYYIEHHGLRCLPLRNFSDILLPFHAIYCILLIILVCLIL